jgi:hypothetical protein
VWTAIRKQWDYVALTRLLGLDVTAAVTAGPVPGSDVLTPAASVGWLTTSKSG